MRTKVGGDVLTLYPEGHVDSKNAGDFERDVMEALDSAPDASIVFDINELEYISSAGLRVLMKVMRRSKDTIKVLNASPEVYEVFEVTGFSEMMDVTKRV